MKNVYVGEAVLTLEIRRLYEEILDDENVHGNVHMSENEGLFEILLYEDSDFIIPNNPFSDITDYPLNVSFSFDKLIMDKDFVYNMWMIKIPFDEIERVIEEYEDDIPEHEYNINFKNGSQIKIIGKCHFLNPEDDYNLLDPESVIGDIRNIHREIYNKVHISCETTEKEIHINYLKNKIKSHNDYMEFAPNPRNSASDIQRIAEYIKQLKELENGE